MSQTFVRVTFLGVIIYLNWAKRQKNVRIIYYAIKDVLTSYI